LQGGERKKPKNRFDLFPEGLGKETVKITKRFQGSAIVHNEDHSLQASAHKKRITHHRKRENKYVRYVAGTKAASQGRGKQGPGQLIPSFPKRNKKEKGHRPGEE